MVPCADNGTLMGRPESSSRFLLSSSSLVDPDEMGGMNMFITCSLRDNFNVIKVHALVDCGATGNAFIDDDFVRHNYLPLMTSHEVGGANG